MRRRDSDEIDILFIGTRAEWRDVLEFLWKQPTLPVKLARVETLLAYKFGFDNYTDRLDEDLKIDRAVKSWGKTQVVWIPDKKSWLDRMIEKWLGLVKTQ